MKTIPYRYGLLVVLGATAVFTTLDRIVLGLLLPGIKSDLHLSDTELGMLSGLAFALFYALMGLPLPSCGMLFTGVPTHGYGGVQVLSVVMGLSLGEK